MTAYGALLTPRTFILVLCALHIVSVVIRARVPATNDVSQQIQIATHHDHNLNQPIAVDDKRMRQTHAFCTISYHISKGEEK